MQALQKERERKRKREKEKERERERKREKERERKREGVSEWVSERERESKRVRERVREETWNICPFGVWMLDPLSDTVKEVTSWQNCPGYSLAAVQSPWPRMHGKVVLSSAWRGIRIKM